MKNLEYKAPDGNKWLCGEFDALHEKFNIGDKDGFGMEQGMSHLHKVMSMQGGVIWDAVQRLYSVWPLFGLNPDSETKWDMGMVAKKYGLTKPILEKNMQKAVEYWTAKKAELVYGEFIADDDELLGDAEEDRGVISFNSLYVDFDEAKVKEYLQAVGMDDELDDPVLRLNIADRASALWNELQQKNMRTTAIAVLRMEVNMSDAVKSKTWCFKRKSELMKISDPSKENRAEIVDLEKRIRVLDKSYNELTEKHGKTLERLGVDESDQNQQKRTFIKSVSYMFNRVAKYYADPERSLHDGVFTAAEIDWLLTPVGMRPAQYRPDVVVRLEEALAPENFHDENYNPTPLQRDVVRDLHKIVKYVREDAEQKFIAGVDDVEAGEDEGYQVASEEQEIIDADEAAGDEVQGSVMGFTRVLVDDDEGVIG